MPILPSFARGSQYNAYSLEAEFDDSSSSQDSVYFSYWVPYSYSKHRDLIARLQMNEKTKLEVLGQSIDGRDIDLLIVGNAVTTISMRCECSSKACPSLCNLKQCLKCF